LSSVVSVGLEICAEKGHAHGLIHVGERRGGHGEKGVDHLRGKIGRVFVIQIDDTLEDPPVDDLVPGALLHATTYSTEDLNNAAFICDETPRTWVVAGSMTFRSEYDRKECILWGRARERATNGVGNELQGSGLQVPPYRPIKYE
jgi:hypothetical protein